MHFINFTFLLSVFNLFTHLNKKYRYFTDFVEKTHIAGLRLLHSLASVTLGLSIVWITRNDSLSLRSYVLSFIALPWEIRLYIRYNQKNISDRPNNSTHKSKSMLNTYMNNCQNIHKRYLFRHWTLFFFY